MSIAAITLDGYGNGTVVSTIANVARGGMAAYVAVVEPPAAGKQYVDVAGLPWASTDVSLFAGASPAVANGDIVVIDTVTTPDSFAITLLGTGVPIIDSRGSTARQSLVMDVYDVSAVAFYGVVTDYVNNHPPQAVDVQSFAYNYYLGGAAATIDLSQFWTDQENDTITYAVASDSPSPLPADVVKVGATLTVTPTTLQTTSVKFQAADSLGEVDTAASMTLTFTLADLPAPPTLSGTFITDHGYQLATGTFTLDLSVFATGQTSYSIAPALSTGITFDTLGGIMTIDTATVAAGTYGPYTITFTNAGGSTASNTFSIITSVTPLIGVPTVFGLVEALGDAAIVAAGLTHNASHDLSGYYGQAVRGIIIGTNPLAGTPVAAGTEVIFIIAMGPLTFLALKT